MGRGIQCCSVGLISSPFVTLAVGPSIVVCDEGHVLKNDLTNLSKAMSGLKTGRRIILTGTPLQNNLKEYHCMVNFVKPGLLGTKNEFLNRFVNPIANGQCADSTVHDVKLMKKRVHILHRLLDGCVQRCDYSALAPYLPPKYEYVISVRLSDVQVSLYRHFLQNLTRNANGQQGTGGSLFNDHTMLRCIWTHPVLLRMSADRTAARNLLREEREEDESDMASFIDDDPVTDKSTPDSDDDNDDVVCLDKEKEAQSDKEGPSTRSRRRAKKKDDDESSGDEVITAWQTRSRGDGEERPQTPPKPAKKEWWDQYVSEEDIEKLQMSGKMTLLYNILQECDAIGDKVLLFSQSLLTLDMVEKMLEECDERAQAVDPETALVDPLDPFRDCHNSWVPGFDYFRMDGSTNVDLRTRWIEMFNDPANLRGRLFLISTKAGSLGTNLEKIYDRQVTKQSLSCRVVDEQQIERHFKASDLQELYTFNPDSKSNRPTPMLPKDRLLAELLIRHKDWIVTYHEHDSLLQNIVDEDLTEEERKLAWEEYKDEREGRLKTTFDNIQATGTGQTFRLTLDLNAIIADIKAKASTRAATAFPSMTSEMLVAQLRNVLLAYRNTFQQRQTAAFQKRGEFLKEKLVVPNEILKDLTEAGLAIQQLNQVLSKLQNIVLPAEQIYTVAYQYMLRRGASQQAAREYALKQQKQAFQRLLMQMGTSTNITTGPVISEVDDDAPSTASSAAPSSSSSSVVITEID
ncbi:hypothetical protein HPB48_014799 [Haemaphysalis longicornis]|uniref:Helicase ATP-binding domain-containing protein n=1 Tax=Haemaphysalis longicornis TaxID=44386 RepID=A0A9J6GGX6_HAELO|nr:hypothetical protein HPB48_014799 [Haemaphysalis longicornis]